MAVFAPENLKPVAQALQAKEPDIILICGDNDHHLGFGNQHVGRYQAEAAAKAVGGRAATPSFLPEEREQGMADYNDLWRSSGLKPRHYQIEASLSVLEAQEAQEQEAQTGDG